MRGIKIWILAVMTVFFLKCNTHGRLSESSFLNEVEVSSSTYRNDSIKLLSLLNKNLSERVAPFSGKEYSDSTIILVDTIIYNEQKNKIAFFILIKNRSSKLADPDRSYSFYYDGFCYLGQKINQDTSWSIRWFPVFNVVTYYNLSEARERIRHKYFEELAAIKDTTGNPYYKHNLNDTRFWDGVAWK